MAPFFDTFLTHLFPRIGQKRREGKGVRKRAVRNRLKKSVKRVSFQGPALSQIQGARSRGFGRNCPEVNNTLFDPSRGRKDRILLSYIWLSPRLFPQRDSRYNTLSFPSLSLLGLEAQEASQEQEQGLQGLLAQRE